jgi:hypothetical protein
LGGSDRIRIINSIPEPSKSQNWLRNTNASWQKDCNRRASLTGTNPTQDIDEIWKAIAYIDFAKAFLASCLMQNARSVLQFA